jgi:hypothetical protein
VAMPESTYLKLLNITSYENTFPVVWTAIIWDCLVNGL